MAVVPMRVHHPAPRYLVCDAADRFASSLLYPLAFTASIAASASPTYTGFTCFVPPCGLATLAENIPVNAVYRRHVVCFGRRQSYSGASAYQGHRSGLGEDCCGSPLPAYPASSSFYPLFYHASSPREAGATGEGRRIGETCVVDSGLAYPTTDPDAVGVSGNIREQLLKDSIRKDRDSGK